MTSRSTLLRRRDTPSARRDRECVPISAERVLEVVDHLDGGRRVVDGRRQRPDRDVDEDPEREGRILVDRPLDPERDPARQPPLGNPRERRRARAPRAGPRSEETKSPTPWRHHDDRVVVGRPGEQALVVDCLDRSRPSCFGRRASAPGEDLVELGVGAGAAPRARELDRACGAPPGRRSHERGHLDRAEPVEKRSRKTRNRTSPAPSEEPGHRDAEVGHVLVDAAQERVGERERPHENGERRFEHAVAVPEAHVAGRERAGRHLHDEDAHRDDEPGQADGRADDGRQHRQRGLRRIVPAVRDEGPAFDPARSRC